MVATSAASASGRNRVAHACYVAPLRMDIPGVMKSRYLLSNAEIYARLSYSSQVKENGAPIHYKGIYPSDQIFALDFLFYLLENEVVLCLYNKYVSTY